MKIFLPIITLICGFSAGFFLNRLTEDYGAYKEIRTKATNEDIPLIEYSKFINENPSFNKKIKKMEEIIKEENLLVGKLSLHLLYKVENNETTQLKERLLSTLKYAYNRIPNQTDGQKKFKKDVDKYFLDKSKRLENN